MSEWDEAAALLDGPYLAAYGEHYGDGLPGFAHQGGALCRVKVSGSEETFEPLANFDALIVEEQRLDDGQSEDAQYLVEGIHNFRELPRLAVSAKQFNSLAWLSRWPSSVSLMPTYGAERRLCYAMRAGGVEARKHAHIHIATGWRPGGYYVHGGGAIGRENAMVALEGSLARYELPEASTDGAKASARLLRAYPMGVSAPLLGLMYLAPLVDFLQGAKCAPGVTLWLCGSTQSGKSTAAGLFMSHYGSGLCSAKNAPASFHDSPAALRKKAYLLKDMPLWVDDYHPVASRQAREKMDALAQTMIRGWSNRTDAARANSDLSLRAPMPPRGVGLCTGEDLPGVTESGLARLYVVRMGRGDKIPLDTLREMQQAGESGLLAAGMAGYIDWLRGQSGEEMKQRFQSLHRSVVDLVPDDGGDLAENVAFLALGLNMALDYFAACGVEDTEKLKALGLSAMLAGAADQSKSLHEEKPWALFLETLQALLDTKTVLVQDGGGPLMGPDFVGWRRDGWYYLLPIPVYSAVQQALGKQGRSFPLQRGQLQRVLVEAGVATPGSDGAPTAVKKLGGKTYRVLCIPEGVMNAC